MYRTSAEARNSDNKSPHLVAPIRSRLHTILSGFLSPDNVHNIADGEVSGDVNETTNKLGRRNALISDICDAVVTEFGATLSRNTRLESKNKLLEDELRITRAKLVESEHEVQKSKEKFDRQVEAIAARNEAQLDQMKQKHDSKLAILVNEQNVKEAEWNKAYETDFAKLKEACDIDIANLSREHKENLMDEQRKYDHLNDIMRHAVQQFEIEVRELNTVVLARDESVFQLGRLTHHESSLFDDDWVKSKFLELAVYVDDFARNQWKDDRQLWTDGQLQSRGSNGPPLRLLKKNILQHHIWLFLHVNIFCSPFRSFGEEGKMLEKQWNEHCGQDSAHANEFFTWPKPSPINERWRYLTVKECYSAITLAISEFDPRVKLKKDTKLHISEIHKDLTSTLGSVINLEGLQIESLRKLIRQATNTWLELSMKRPRLVITIPGSNSDLTIDKPLSIQQNPQQWTVMPQVGRYGNLQGYGMDDYVVIRGCAGETMTWP